MVYKKYIKRGGKTYGPYFYKSIKKDGKVITEYVGGPETVSKKLFNWLFILGAVTFLLLSFFILNFSLTGKISSEIQTSYAVGELLNGNLKFNLKEGELVPADSKVIVNFGSSTKEYFLSELVDDETIPGYYFIEDLSLLGEGAGYGVVGSKKIYPNVSFQLKIIDEAPQAYPETFPEETPTEGKVEESETEVEEPEVEPPLGGDSSKDTQGGHENNQELREPLQGLQAGDSTEPSAEPEENVIATVEETGSAEETQEVVPEVVEETIVEVQTEKEIAKAEKEEVKEEEKDTLKGTSEKKEEKISPMTGEVVGGLSVFGVVSKGNDFVYEMNKNKDAELVSGSVMAMAPQAYTKEVREPTEAGPDTFPAKMSTGGRILEDKEVKVKNSNEQVVVSTNYYYEEEGFGEDYLGGKGLQLVIDVNKFNLTAENSVLNIYLVYEGQTIVEVSEEINVDEVVEEFPLGNDSAEPNETIIVNETEILNETIVLDVVRDNISTIQYGAVLGKPVKWKKKITDEDGKFNIEIPKEAENITVYKLNEVLLPSSEGNETETIEEVINETSLVNETTPQAYTKEVREPTEAGPETFPSEMSTGGNETEISGSILTGQSIKKIERTKINAQVVSGKISAELDVKEKSPLLDFFKNLFSRITGRTIDVTETNETKEVVIDENATEFEIEYVTPASVSFEENTSRGKQITISSDVHYENILAYTELSEPVSEWQIKLYRITNGTREQVNFIGYSDEENEDAKESLNDLTSTEGDEIMDRVSGNVGSTSSVNVTNETISENETLESVGITGDVIGEISDEIIEEVNETILEINETVLENETECYTVNCTLTPPGVPQNLGGNETEVSETVVNKTEVRSEKLVNYIEWVVPHLSNETYELELTILNVQSYPTVGGNWTVAFNTSGEANLTVSLYNGTIYGFEGQNATVEICEFNETSNETTCENVEKPIDLEYLETKCGNSTLNMIVRINGTDIPYDIYLKKKRIEEIRRELE